jgi:UDP-N-acetylglucosamine--N-acetylmuramyl-(pentapeptide) pyrophosphoryl-undecaprenol N-acetylglucosamine transferase
MLTTSTKIRIALTGGGTGGHVYPLVATMEAMQAYVQQGYNIEFHYFGARDAWSEEVLGRGAQFHRIAAGKWRRYFSLLNLFDIPKIIWAFWQALWKMFFVMPDALFSKGGPGAWPVVVAAWFYRIPVVIHESDAVPGLTSLLSAPFSRRIALGFESAGHYFNPKKIVTTGNPVRQSLLEKRLEQTAAKTELGFLPNRPLLVVIGGSQGAQALNEFILLNLKSILPIAQVYHQTGKANFMDVEKLSQAALLEVPAGAEAGSRYKAVPYLDDRTAGLGFSAADLILSPGRSRIDCGVRRFREAHGARAAPGTSGRKRRRGTGERRCAHYRTDQSHRADFRLHLAGDRRERGCEKQDERGRSKTLPP